MARDASVTLEKKSMRNEYSPRKIWAFAVLLSCFLLTVGCGDSQVALSVRVLGCDSKKPLQNTQVVLGDATGALIDTAETDSLGRVAFDERPVDAMVSVAYRNFYEGGFSLDTVTDINNDNLTLYVCSSSAPLGIEYVGKVWLTYLNSPPEAAAYKIYGGTESYDGSFIIQGSDLNSDGTFSLIVIVYNNADNALSYGIARGLSFPANQEELAISMDVGNAFGDFTATVANLPADVSSLELIHELDIKNKSYGIFRKTFSGPTSPMTDELFSIPAQGDKYMVGIEAHLDTDADGVEDAFAYMESVSPALTDVYSDYAQALALPGSVSITNSTEARPTIRWTTGAAVSPDFLQVQIFYASTGVSIMSANVYTVTLPADRNEFTLPELPDALDAYRPRSGLAPTKASIVLSDYSVFSGYDDYLGKMAVYSSGITSIFNLDFWAGCGAHRMPRETAGTYSLPSSYTGRSAGRCLSIID